MLNNEHGVESLTWRLSRRCEENIFRLLEHTFFFGAPGVVIWTLGMKYTLLEPVKWVALHDETRASCSRNCLGKLLLVEPQTFL